MALITSSATALAFVLASRSVTAIFDTIYRFIYLTFIQISNRMFTLNKIPSVRKIIGANENNTNDNFQLVEKPILPKQETIDFDLMEFVY